MSDYAPPFNLTPAIVALVANISEMVGQSTAVEATKHPLLRKINRIRTIQGSLAIEGNTLGQEEITAIVEDKRIMAPPREIQEVRNAIKAYDCLEKWNPCSLDDLLKAHQTLMAGLLDLPGAFRNGGVAVMAGENIAHLAPPSDRVPFLMSHLLQWLRTTAHHPLISASIFHYEFEFIHPFDDGNGRLGRLWQTLILYKWNPIFLFIPVESIVRDNQAAYYDAISKSTEQTDVAIFVHFMLETVQEAIKQLAAPQVTPQVAPQVKHMLTLLRQPMTRKEIQQKMGLRDTKHFRNKYLRPALMLGLIEMTIPDKPNSRLQQYRLTPTGKAALQ